MNRKIIFVLIIGLFFSCKDRNNNNADGKTDLSNQTINQKQTLDWKAEVIDFTPDDVNLARNKLLSVNSPDDFLADKAIPKEDKAFVVNIILLKLYLYHLQVANQGYNLLEMRTGNAKSIVDYFFEENSINEDQEFINSAAAYNILKEDATNVEVINDLIKSIELELTPSFR